MMAIFSSTCLKCWISPFRVLFVPCINVRPNDSSNCFPFLFSGYSHSKSADSFSRYCNHQIYFLFKFDIMWSALVKWLHLLCDEHFSVQFQDHPVTMTTVFYQSAYSLLLLIWAIGNNPYQSVFLYEARIHFHPILKPWLLSMFSCRR